MSTEANPPELSDLVQVPEALEPRRTQVGPLRGVTPSGDLAVFNFVADWCLLVFLSTSCDGCHVLWEALGDPNGPSFGTDISVVVVTRGPTDESAAGVAGLAGQANVIMSDEAWPNYAVHASPFFVVVDGLARQVVSEGVAWSVHQIQQAIEAARTRGERCAPS